MTGLIIALRSAKMLLIYMDIFMDMALFYPSVA
jgi:hypothetical protein